MLSLFQKSTLACFFFKVHLRVFKRDRYCPAGCKFLMVSMTSMLKSDRSDMFCMSGFLKSIIFFYTPSTIFASMLSFLLISRATFKVGSQRPVK